LEQEHLEYLREAAHALSALKKQTALTVSSTPPPNSNNSSRNNNNSNNNNSNTNNNTGGMMVASPASVDSASLSPLRTLSASTYLATPNDNSAGHGGGGRCCAPGSHRKRSSQTTGHSLLPNLVFPQTPDPSIQSPPIPKKQIFPTGYAAAATAPPPLTTATTTTNADETTTTTTTPVAAAAATESIPPLSPVLEANLSPRILDVAEEEAATTTLSRTSDRNPCENELVEETTTTNAIWK